MDAKPLDLTLEVAPKARFDVVEMRSRFAVEHEALAAYSHCLYWSSHTTAGFLDRSITARLSTQNVSTFVEAFRTLFPEGAGYEHDQMERRADLDASQRKIEKYHILWTDFSLKAISIKYRAAVSQNSNTAYDRTSAESAIMAGENATRMRAITLAALPKTIPIHLYATQQSAVPASTEGKRIISSERPRKRQ